MKKEHLILGFLAYGLPKLGNKKLIIFIWLAVFKHLLKIKNENLPTCGRLFCNYYTYMKLDLIGYA
jgi:hypothetical protein